MPLEWQNVPLPFLGGVSTKPDEKVLPPQKLAEAENVSFERPGAIRKANGFRALGTGIVGSALPISAGQAVATYRDELLLGSGSKVYSYDQSLDSWADKGSFRSAYVTQRPVVRNTYAQTAQDSVTHSMGLLVAAWEDSQGGVRYAAIDTVTGVTLVSDGLVDASGSRPKVVAIGNYVLIFWVNGTAVKYAPIAVSAPQTLGTAVFVTNSLAAASAYSAAVIGQRVHVAYATATGWSVLYYSSTLVASSPQSVATTTPTAITVFEDSLSQNVALAWYNGTSVLAQVRTYDLATVVMATATVETLANVVNVTGCAIPGAASSLRVFYTTSAAATYNYLTRQATIAAYGAASAAAFLRSVALAGRAFLYDSTVFVPLAFQSTLQSTYFVADSSGNVVAKILPGLGGGIPARPLLPTVTSLGGSKFQLSFLAKDLLTTTGGAVATLTGVTAVTLDFHDGQRSYARAELGDALHLGGGFLAMYDGAGVVEHGFHLYPENVTTANLDADTGTTYAYGYAVCYEWTDNQGLIHRSAPSIAVQQQKLNKVDGTHRVTVTIPTLRITAKQSARRKVQCVVYRTEANGTTYYQASSFSSPTYNDTTADTVAFADSVTDATLIGNPKLYTTGGVVENVAPGPISGLTVHQSRVIAQDSLNPLQLWWSRQVVPGAPVEFSDLFVQNVDPIGGDIVTTARMDAWLVIFKERGILVTSEEGPSAAGDYTFSSGQMVPTNVGCLNPRSVNLGSDGLVFQSAKGWHLLNRSLQVQDLPDVYGWKSATPVGAHTMVNVSETRFVLGDGTTLVHDDFTDQWSLRSNTLAVDSVIWQGVQTFLRPDGRVRQETPGVFTDAGRAIARTIKTAWIQLAGLSGFQRIKTLTVLGEHIGPHRLRVSIAYDFNPVPSQVSEINATALGQPVYGADSVYGGAALPTDSLVYGGTFPAYAFRVNLAQQKCTAIQVTIEDFPGTPFGEACSITGITLVAGLKAGTRKLPATRQA